MRKIFFLIILFSFCRSFSQSGSPDCANSEPACSDTTGVKIFPNVTGQTTGPAYGCLLESPNAAWFFIRVENSGKLAFNIIQNTFFDTDGNPTGSPIDVDFVAWGPFDTPDNNCNSLAKKCTNSEGAEIECPSNNDTSRLNNLDGLFYINNVDNSNIIDCSFSGESEEKFTIPNAEAGKFYLLLVSNYPDIGTPGTPGFIKLEQSNFGQTDAGETDCSIITGELGEDQNVCDGTTISLDATPDTETTDYTYEWLVDTGNGGGFTTITGETNPTLEITNNLSGTYKSIVTDVNGDDGSDEVVITFFEIPIANPVEDLQGCDTNRNGMGEFNFDIDASPQVLGNQDATKFEVLYFKTRDAAEANIIGTNITSPYTTGTSETIYARIHNKENPTCSNIISFEIHVREVPVPNQPSNYEICDNSDSGSDTDGVVTTFRLDSKDTEILGDNNDASQFSVSYHTTLLGAQTSSNTDAIDKTSNYTVTNSQKIYVRIENVNASKCAVVSNETTRSNFTPFELIVSPLPSVQNSVTILQCHDKPDLNTSVNLTLAQINISPNYIAKEETFKYYPSETDAINDTNEITDANIYNYPVTATGEAWARTISNKGCYRISKIEIRVSINADLPYDKPLTTCDDFLDANGSNNSQNNDTDGISSFDLTDVVKDIKDFFSDAVQRNQKVLFYESESDRTSSINDINSNINYGVTNFRNSNSPNNQTIYIKILDTTNNNCNGTAKLFLNVLNTPIANEVITTPISFCDDFNSGASTDGENTGINLRNTVDEILGNTQNETNYKVTYHTSQEDATSGNNPITNDTDFRNTAPADFNIGSISKQTIYVRVENRTTFCYNDHINFDLQILPLPKLDHAIEIEVCDNDTNPRDRITKNINLTSKNDLILNGRDANEFDIWFYKTKEDVSNDGPIIDPENYQNSVATTTFPENMNSDNPGIETIFFIIHNKSTGCNSNLFTLALRIFPEPNIPKNISNYTDCDHNHNGMDDDTDGVVDNINLAAKIPEILNNYPPDAHTNFKVSFHKSPIDASTGNNPINETNYTNQTSNDTFFVRVENLQTGCIASELNFQVLINPLPSYNTMDSSQTVCLNNLPLTLSINNPLKTYQYQWLSHKTNNTISTTQTANITEEGTYTLTVTNPDTSCKRTQDFSITASEVANLTTKNIAIIDSTSDIGAQNFSVTIDPVGLGVGDYEYALLDEDGEIVKAYQDHLKFDQLLGGFYTLTTRDKNGCGNNSIEVPIVEFPKFFTPNGDGINDTWNIKGGNKTYGPSSEITIFNRFGKLVGQVKLGDQGWDGTYNNKPLPEDNYWFSIQLTPLDTSKKSISKTGHFSLLRK